MECLFQKLSKELGNLKKYSKGIAVFSAPLTLDNGKKRSLTDVMLEQGRNAEKGHYAVTRYRNQIDI